MTTTALPTITDLWNELVAATMGLAAALPRALNNTDLGNEARAMLVAHAAANNGVPEELNTVAAMLERQLGADAWRIQAWIVGARAVAATQREIYRDTQDQEWMDDFGHTLLPQMREITALCRQIMEG